MIFSNPNDRCDLSSIPTSGPFTKFFTTLQFYPKDPPLLLFFNVHVEVAPATDRLQCGPFFACNLFNFELKIIKTHRL